MACRNATSTTLLAMLTFCGAALMLLSDPSEAFFTAPKNAGTLSRRTRGPIPESSSSSSHVLSMVPRFDPSTGRWEAGSDEDTSLAGYGPFGTLVRFGPKPLLIRIANEDAYEQGVYKMMANEGMSRTEAQGNFDAYLENPQDWAFQKMEEKRGGFKKDYGAAPSKKQLALSGVWSVVVVWFFYTFITDCLAGKYGLSPVAGVGGGTEWFQ